MKNIVKIEKLINYLESNSSADNEHRNEILDGLKKAKDDYYLRVVAIKHGKEEEESTSDSYTSLFQL